MQTLCAKCIMQRMQRFLLRNHGGRLLRIHLRHDGFGILFAMFCRVECAGFSIRLIPYSSKPVCALATSPINAKGLRFLTKGRW